MTKNNSLHIDNLQIGYLTKKQKINLCEPISVKASAGSLIALIGPNGAGKSTLIKTLCRLHAALGGQILVEGESQQNISRTAYAKKVSLVSTELLRFNNLTVAEVVALGRYPYGQWYQHISSDDQVFIDEALKNVGMETFNQRLVNSLSDGEFQRVMIARALAQDTPILILDEPTAFLDLANKHHMVSLLWQLARTQNKTILFSTHDLNIAMQFADVFWVLTKQGLSYGAPEDMLLNGTLKSLYAETGLTFDADKMQFAYPHKKTHNVHIKGEGYAVTLTKLALERLGFETDCNKAATFVVSIVVKDGQNYWSLNEDEKKRFLTLMELQQEIKTNYL
jgi:iron complex transport system ATP-binding protein